MTDTEFSIFAIKHNLIADASKSLAWNADNAISYPDLTHDQANAIFEFLFPLSPRKEPRHAKRA